MDLADAEMDGSSYTSPTGTLRLNLRIDRFAEGPASGAQHVGARLLELRVVQAGPPGSNQPPQTRVLAVGPVPLTVWAPQSVMPQFAGDFELPAGRILAVEAVVDDALLVDAVGTTHEIVFGAQGSDVGILRFGLPPATPAPTVEAGATLGWNLTIPAGAGGALQPISGGRFRLNPSLLGGKAEYPLAFGFHERRLLVRYSPSATVAQVAAFEDEVDATTVWTSPTGLRVVEFAEGDWHGILLRYQAFLSSPMVASVLLDPLTESTGMDSTYVDDFSFDVEGQDWMWDARIAPADDASTDFAWEYTHGSREVVVGFLDGGLDTNHPDLINNLYVNADELPAGLVGTCGLDPDSLGLTAAEALDFDGDGVFTLHDLNTELADETVRAETLDLLDACGYVVSASASSAFEASDLPSAIVQGDDLLATFADGIDDDGNGYVDDLFGPNLRAHDGRCHDGTWTAGCDDWDINNDDACDLSLSAQCVDQPGLTHGTQMAGLAAAEGDNGRNIAGVAMEARVLEARIGVGGKTTSVSMALEGMEYMSAKGAHIVIWEAAMMQSMPYGCAEAFGDQLAAELEVYPEILFVLAAGNYALDCDDPDLFCFPARAGASNAISVAATEHVLADDSVAGVEAGELVGIWSQSNWGATSIQLAAPGASPYTLSNGFPDSTNPYWFHYTGAQMLTAGTSASVAIVGGVAALYLAECGDPYDGTAVAAAIRGSARERGSEMSCLAGDCVQSGRFIDAGALVGSCAGP